MMEYRSLLAIGLFDHACCLKLETIKAVLGSLTSCPSQIELSRQRNWILSR
jgi:hypothetical protein